MRFVSGPILLVVLCCLVCSAQDTLPSFSAVIKQNGKVVISWHNKYKTVSQISIQRSTDSTRNFSTQLTVPDPSIPENGFVDNKAASPNMYYRLFILLDNSRYVFTKSKRAVPEQLVVAAKTPDANTEDPVLQRADNQRIRYMQDIKEKPAITGPTKITGNRAVSVEKTIYVRTKDSLIIELPAHRLQQFRDSMLTKTKDTLMFITGDSVVIKPFVAKEVYKVSNFVFTDKEGNVNIVLPDVGRKKFTVRFMEQDNSLVLEVKDIKDKLLIVDKSNFIHAGWFRFELYEEGKLKEKNKFFIPKEF